MKTEIWQAQSPHNAMRSTGKKYQKCYRVFQKSARLWRLTIKKDWMYFSSLWKQITDDS